VLRGVKRGEPAICNRPCDQEDLSCEIEDEQAHIALGCRDTLLRAYNDDYQAEKENRNKDSNRTIHDSLPNVRDDGSPLAFGADPATAGCVTKVPKAW